MDHNQRIKIYEETKEICKKSFIPKQESTLYVSPMREMYLSAYRPYTTEVLVIDSDTLDAAYSYVKQGRDRVAVLNMANDKHAGGGVDNGAGAQEENIFRRSALCLHLDQRVYPLTSNKSPTRLLWSHNVAIFRQNEMEGYKLMKTPYYVDIITLAGLFRPKIVDGNISTSAEWILRDKLHLLFQTAIVENCDTLILSALGCGAWNNPPEPVAKIFREVMTVYDGYFRSIVFAILTEAPGAKGISENNFETFKRVLLSN